MSKQLDVKVTSRKSGDQEWFEATVTLPGLKPTKVARKSDGNTKFPTRSALKGAVKKLAELIQFAEPNLAEEAKPAKAAKKSVKKTPAPPAPPAPEVTG